MSSPDLPIRNFLGLSAAHLREETCDLLGSYEDVLAHRTNYGWLMYAPTSSGDLAGGGDLPEELLLIIKLARDEACAYVLFDCDAFDCDAPKIDQLPAFDW
ncbi:DUF5983 family protein [Streptomyces sp. NPDC001073]